MFVLLDTNYQPCVCVSPTLNANLALFFILGKKKSLGIVDLQNVSNVDEQK
jgi:hypothetical protein